MIQARYTVVLKNIMDNEDSKPKLDKAMSTYPLYEKKSKEEFIPSYIPSRSELNQKILNAYKYREIGFETVGRFLDELEISLCEIMPRYNLLFLTADQDFNIIWNVDYKKEIDTHRTGSVSDSRTDNENMNNTVTGESETNTQGTDKSTTESNVNNHSKNVHSATPQDQLNITAKGIDSVDYADDVTWNQNLNSDDATTEGESTGKTEQKSTTGTEAESQRTSIGEGSSQGTEKTTETTKGNFGVVSAQDLIMKYRDTIINIEQMIINDERISELFMRVF